MSILQGSTPQRRVTTGPSQSTTPTTPLWGWAQSTKGLPSPPIPPERPCFTPRISAQVRWRCMITLFTLLERPVANNKTKLNGPRSNHNEKSPGTRRGSFMQRSRTDDSIVQPIAAVAPELEADAPIGIGAEHVSVLDDRVVVRVARGPGVVVRARLRDRRGCHESGKGNCG